jgi:HD-like signal output (HDOD) protein
MVIYFSVLLLTVLSAGFGMALRPAFRRALTTTTTSRTSTPEVAAPPVPLTLELPAELQHLPEPPMLEAAPVEILLPPEISKRLRQLELGLQDLGSPLPDDHPVVASVLAAISDPATQKRLTPRRPNLLPQLMRAINDEEASRRELSAIIARDPSIVGSLLKMANSAYYRVAAGRVESIERAVVILGTDGLRSLVASSILQPIFQINSAKVFSRFPEIVWDHAQRSAHAAIPHAALVERTDAFGAELLCLITGLAEIILFRATIDHCENNPEQKKHRPTPQLIAALLASQAPVFAWRLGAEWELSELMLAALEEQTVTAEPTTPLGRSLRFGRIAGALAVLHTNSIVDDTTVRLSLPEAGLSPPHMKCMWSRLLNELEDPRLARRKAA